MPTNPGKTNLIEWWALAASSGNETGSHASKVLTDNNTVGYQATGGPASDPVRDFVLANSEYFSITDSAFNFQDTSFSIGLWVRIDVDNGVAVYLIARGVTGTNHRQFGVLINTGRQVGFVLSSNGSTWGTTATWSTALSVGTWYFVVAAHDHVNNLVKISVDGGAFTTAAHSGGAHNSASQPMGIGAHPNPTAYLDGRISRVAFWSKVLSDDEVDYLHNSGTPIDYDDLATTHEGAAAPAGAGAVTAAGTVDEGGVTHEGAAAPAGAGAAAGAGSVTRAGAAAAAGAGAASAAGWTDTRFADLRLDHPDLLDRFQVHLRPPDRSTGASYLLPRFVSLNVTGTKYGGGDGSLTLIDDGHPLITAMLRAAGYGYSVDVYYNTLLLPIFSGVVRNFAAQSLIEGHSTITLQLESIPQHILRRRLSVSSSNATVDILTTPADNAVLTLIRNAFGAVVPGNYPAGVTRGTWGPGPITAAAVAANKTPGWGVNANYSEESRNNLLDAVTQILERHGLALTCSEGPAGTWTFDVPGAYQRVDRTATMVLSDASHTALSIERVVDFSALENVFVMGGDGKGTGQALVWDADLPSVSYYGAYESSATRGNVTNTTALTEAAKAEVARGANPIETWRVRIRPRDGAMLLFNGEGRFGIRDLVRIESYRLAGLVPLVGSGPDGYENLTDPITTDQLVVGYTLSANGYTEPALELVLGKPERNIFWEVLAKVGQRGGRQNGDWRTINGA